MLNDLIDPIQYQSIWISLRIIHALMNYFFNEIMYGFDEFMNIGLLKLLQARKFAAFCDCRMVSVVGGRDAEQQARSWDGPGSWDGIHR